MSKFWRIDLREHVSSDGPIEFLYAEVSAPSTGPLAIVHYADEGKEQQYGLRFDMDKRVFIDHLDDPEKDGAITASADTVATVIFKGVQKA